MSIKSYRQTEQSAVVEKNIVIFSLRGIPFFLKLNNFKIRVGVWVRRKGLFELKSEHECMSGQQKNNEALCHQFCHFF